MGTAPQSPLCDCISFLSGIDLANIFSPLNQFSSVQLLSHVRLFATLWTAACQASLSITNSWSLLKLMSIELVMSSNHLILCPPLFPLPSMFPSFGSFLMSQFFTSGDQSIGVSASATVLPMNIQHWFPLGLTGWISLQSKGLSRVFSNTTIQKNNLLVLSFRYDSAFTSMHEYWKNHSFDYKDFCWQSEVSVF